MASVFSVKLEPGSFAGGEKHAQRLELEQRFEKTSEGKKPGPCGRFLGHEQF